MKDSFLVGTIPKSYKSRIQEYRRKGLIQVEYNFSVQFLDQFQNHTVFSIFTFHHCPSSITDQNCWGHRNLWAIRIAQLLYPGYASIVSKMFTNNVWMIRDVGYIICLKCCVESINWFSYYDYRLLQIDALDPFNKVFNFCGWFNLKKSLFAFHFKLYIIMK